MQAKIETLKAKNSNDEEYIVYPRTLIKCVTNEHGDNLQDLISDTILEADGRVYVDYGSHEETDDYVPVDADTLDGKEASYYATAESVADIVDGATVVGESTKSTFDSDGNKITETYATNVDVDKIQTTSGGFVLNAGNWYRIAKYTYNDTYVAQGNYANGCKILLRAVATTTSCFCEIKLRVITNGVNFLVIDCEGKNQRWSKIRYVTDSVDNCVYIEVYMKADAITEITISESNVMYTNSCWQAITPTLTEETVDGVTVTTTYDIPANAKPVTDLDIDKAMNTYGYTAYSSSTEAGLDEIYNTLHTSNTKGNSCYRAVVSHMTMHSVLGGGVGFVEGYYYSTGQGWQKVTMYTKLLITFYRTMEAGVWTEWTKLPDNANYLPLNGGGILKFYNTSPLCAQNMDSDTRSLISYLSNTEYLGMLGFMSKDIPCFTTTDGFNKELVHSGNVGSYALPISGGTVKGSLVAEVNGTVPLWAMNTGTSEVRVGYRLNGNNMGYLGFKEASKPLFWDANGYTKELLHTGNKPTGTYTGNGSATARYIDLTGAIGRAVIVNGNGYTTIITPYSGAFTANVSTGAVSFVPSVAAFHPTATTPQIILATANGAVNASGVTYYYTVV